MNADKNKDLWNKDTYLSNQDTACVPATQKCTKQPLKLGHLFTSSGPKGVCSREVPLYSIIKRGHQFDDLSIGLNYYIKNYCQCQLISSHGDPTRLVA